MSKNKTTTYGDLKQRKAELQCEMEKGYVAQNIEEYQEILQRIKDVELTQLWSITPNEAYGELPEQVKPKAYKRVKRVVILVSIAVVLAIVLFGCRSTIRGTGQVLQGIGTGTGTIITGVGDYLVEEGQE